MKKHLDTPAFSTISLAVHSALLLMLAMPQIALADDEEVAELIRITNTVEVGVGNTSADSAKFGEYNGLNKSGANVIGNFRLRGGDAYSHGNDLGTGVNTWEIKGNDLGTTSREVSGSVSQQGLWSLGIGYDELQHNISNTYQTPLVGAMGGNAFTMPAGFGVINTAYIQPLTFLSGAQAMTATQKSYFQTVDVHSDRKNTRLVAAYAFDRQWGLKFDYNRLEQTGAKLMSASTDAATALSGPGGSTWGIEKMLILMNPTNYKTDTFNVALNWVGAQGFMNARYHASFFRDGYNGLTFPNAYASTNASTPAMGAAGTYPINTMSTAPSSDYNQLQLNGGYTVSPTTKVAGGFSYGRNTQDDSYPFAMMQGAVPKQATNATALPMGGGSPPQASLNAVVITTHADFKVTNQTTRDLTLSAGLKYNERENQTASTAYNYIDLGGKTRTSVNTPMSNRNTQMEVAGDMRIDPDRRLHLGYEYEDVKRWCNNALANTTQGIAAPVGWGPSSSCVQIPENQESRLVAAYKQKVGDDLNVSASYVYAKRSADVNAFFYNPMQALVEGYENAGYRAFFDASRTEQIVKAGTNWQANEQLSLGLSGRYVDDAYTDSPLGVQKGSTWSANLDATYNISDNTTVSAYLTTQSRRRDMLSGNYRYVVPAANPQFSNQLKDDDNTLGLSFTQKGLMAGKLEVKGDLTYSQGVSGYSTQYPGFVATAAASTCASSASLSCGSTPDIKNEMTQLKLSGTYKVDKSSRIVLGYTYQQLVSSDYYYNFYQTGTTGTGNLPTNEQASNYSITAIAVGYVYNF